MGHLVEMCEGAGLQAVIDFASVPVLEPVADYLDKGCFPGGTIRNFDSYGHKAAPLDERQKMILCDPQTSGGLLIAASGDTLELKQLLGSRDMQCDPIGRLVSGRQGSLVTVV